MINKLVAILFALPAILLVGVVIAEVVDWYTDRSGK